MGFCGDDLEVQLTLGKRIGPGVCGEQIRGNGIFGQGTIRSDQRVPLGLDQAEDRFLRVGVVG